jgi:protein SCO1/2
LWIVRRDVLAQAIVEPDLCNYFMGKSEEATMLRWVRYGLFLLVAFALGFSIHLALQQMEQQPSTQTAESTGKALIGGPFELVNHKGETVTQADFAGKHMLVFFGFTNCPDVCPAKLNSISVALDRLGPLADEVTPLFITVDPERDTPERVAQYVSNFSAQIVGLTGTPEQIRKAAGAYRAYYAKVDLEGSASGYTMDHSAFTYLMDENGEYVTHFAYGDSIDKMAERLRRELGGEKTAAHVGAAPAAQ